MINSIMVISNENQLINQVIKKKIITQFFQMQLIIPPSSYLKSESVYYLYDFYDVSLDDD